MSVRTAARSTAGRRRQHRQTVIGAALAVLAGLAAAPSSEAKEVLAKIGSEQQVNLQADGDQIAPALAADAQGRYAIAWLGPAEGGVFQPYVRLFDAAGTPRSGDIAVGDAPSEAGDFPRSLRLAMAADGRFVVLWTTQHVWARIFDSQGTPLGGPLRTDDGSFLTVLDGDVAMADDGRFLVVWRGTSGSPSIFLRAFDAAAKPLESSRRIDAPAPGFNGRPRLVATSSGAFLTLWVRGRLNGNYDSDDQLVGVLRSGLTGTATPEIALQAQAGRALSDPVAAAQPGGGFSLAWGSAPRILSQDPNGVIYREVRARRFDAQGVPLGPEAVLPFEPGFETGPALATDRYGNALVLVPASGLAARTVGRLFDRDWRPLGDLFEAATYPKDQQLAPVAASSREGFVAAWESGVEFVFPIPFPIPTQDGQGFGIFAQRFAPPLCAEGSKVLCLGAGERFELRTEWTTPSGERGDGRVHRVTSDTGAFWFFAPENLELLTKVLDGSGVNGRFWVFSGALSDVDYTLRVRDSQTGAERTYHNVQGQLVSRADTDAFPGSNGNPAPAIRGLVGEAQSATATLAACGDEVLCFQIDRELRVGIDFIDPRTGVHGTAQAHPLTANTGAFSFFNSGVYEVIVKLLDGGPVNGETWFFYGGLSDVDYTITLEDPASHATKTYHNQHGELASRADTRALPAGASAF